MVLSSLFKMCTFKLISLHLCKKMQKHRKGYFEEHLECAAPNCWSKYTTNSFILTIYVKNIFAAFNNCSRLLEKLRFKIASKIMSLHKTVRRYLVCISRFLVLLAPEIWSKYFFGRFQIFLLILDIFSDLLFF